MIETFGQTLLYLSIVLGWLIFIYSIKIERMNQNDIKRVNVGILIMVTSLWLSFALLVYLFIDKQYQFIVVYSFSDNSMTQSERIMAVWASRQGVMILWAALTVTATLIFSHYLRNDVPDPVVKKSLNIVYFFAALITTFTMTSHPAAFKLGPQVTNGVGLNPSLLSAWQEMHPPLAFLAYSSFIIPYATGISLLTKTSESVEIKRKIYWINDMFMMLGWGLTGIFMVAGSIWGYEENWAGFWAWDPVEIATLVLWLSATLYFHVKTQVANNHPLQSATASLGWVTVTFSAFIVRGGVLDGLHSYAGIAKALVFLFLFIGSTLYWIYALRKPSKIIIPEKLYSLKKAKNKSVLLGLWLIAGALFVNSIGLIMQILFKILFNQKETPYAYYIYFNALFFISIVILFYNYHLDLAGFSKRQKIQIVNLTVIFSGLAISYLTDFTIAGFLVVVLIFSGVLGLFTLIIYETIVKRKKMKKLNIIFIHFTIAVLIFSYVTVDYNTKGVNEALIPGREVYVSEFDISVIGYRVSGNEFPKILILVSHDAGENTELELKQGMHLGNYWTRGAWITQNSYDLYFIMIGSQDMIYSHDAPILIEIQLKPLPNSFRVTFILLIFVTITGLLKYSKMRPIYTNKEE